MDRIVVIEAGKADIAAQDRIPVTKIVQDVIEKGRGRALALGAGDADDLGRKFFHKKTGLGNIFIVVYVCDNARTFDDVIVVRTHGVDLVFRALDEGVCGFGTMGLKEGLRGLSFSSFAPDQ